MELGIQQEVEHNTQGKNTKYIKYFVIRIYSTACISSSKPLQSSWRGLEEEMGFPCGKDAKSLRRCI